jgi:hypothetical protein
VPWRISAAGSPELRQRSEKPSSADDKREIVFCRE